MLHGNSIALCDVEFVMVYVNEFGNSFCECEKKLDGMEDAGMCKEYLFEKTGKKEIRNSRQKQH